MNWPDLIYLAIGVIVWYLLISKVLPKFGVGT